MLSYLILLEEVNLCKVFLDSLYFFFFFTGGSGCAAAGTQAGFCLGG